MKKYLLFTFLLAFTIFQKLFPQQDTLYKNIFLNGSFSLQSNFYNSNFRSLPGYPSCCTKYDFAAGFGQSALIGIGYRQNEKILNSEISYLFGVCFSNLSAKYSIDEFIGYHIDNNNAQKIISNYLLDVKLHTIGLHPSIHIRPPINLPLIFSFGLNFSLPIKSDIYKVEKLKKPDNVYYSDTKSRTRAEQSGKLNDLSKILYSVSFGALLHTINYQNLQIQPKFEIDFGLNNVVSNVNWKIINSKFGVNINYNLPKHIEEPKIQPKNPPLPEPDLPSPPTYDYNLIASYNNIELQDSSYIPISIFQDLEIETVMLPARLFFIKNSDKLNNKLSPTLNISKKFNLDSAFVRFVQINEGDIVVKINRLDDENESIYTKRKEKILEIIKAIAPKRIEQYEFQEILIKKDSINKKIVDEYIYAEFEYKNFGRANFSYYKETDKKYYSRNRNIVFFKADSIDDYQDFKIRILINDSIVYENDKLQSRFNIIDEYYLNDKLTQTPMIVKTEMRLKNGMKLNKDYIYFIKPELRKINFVVNSKDGMEYGVLGLFDYNSSEFLFFDKRIREKAIDDVYIRNKKITIFPSTDNIGSKNYNLQLAEKRAKAAVKLLDLREGDYKIEYIDGYLFDNSSPIGRMLNRSVVVRIEK